MAAVSDDHKPSPAAAIHGGQPVLPVTESDVAAKKPKKLTLLPLIFMIYFEVAGGPYGEEPAVKAAGPLFALIGFLVFPFIWSIPEALVTAELAAAFPGNGGFVIWAERAFGPFWGSLMGTWKFLSIVINIAAFPILCIDYLEILFPVLGSGWPHYLAIFAMILILAFINYTGVAVVGYFAVFLAAISLSPFIVMTVIAIPKIKPHRWISLGQPGVKKDWNLFFNTLFWNLNFWDNVSTLAGEVDRPHRTFPLALFISVIFTCLSYLVPLFAVVGAVSVDQNQWDTGFHAQAAQIIAGNWLKVWLEVGAVLSAIGLFEAQLSSSAFQILGMAEIGVLPEFFALRSKKFGTPVVGILLSTVIVLCASYFNFTVIISAANFLYSLGMLLEFASFIWLRRKMPLLDRPYRIPLGIVGLTVMCLFPSVFLVFVMAIATKIVFVVSGVITVVAVGWYFLMNLCKSKKWLKFSTKFDY